MSSKGVPLHHHAGTSKSEFSERSDMARMHLRDTDREDCVLYRSCLDTLARKRNSNSMCLPCPGCDRFAAAPRRGQ